MKGSTSIRKPAQKLQAENKDSGFYTCANENANDRCSFFISEEDAKPREQAASYNPQSSKPPTSTSTVNSRPRRIKLREQKLPDLWKRGKLMDAFDPQKPTTPQKPPQPEIEEIESPLSNRKRKLSEIEDTPGVSTSLKNMNVSKGQLTPVKPPNFGRPSTGNLNSAQKDPKTPRSSTAGYSTASTTPADSFFSRSTTATKTPDTPKTPGRDEPLDLLKSVFELLEKGNVKLDADTDDELRTLLERSIKQSRGFVMARNMSRAKVQRVESDNKDLNAEIDKRKEELENFKAELSDTNRRYVSLQADFALQQGILADFRNSSREKDDKIKKLKKEVESLKEQLHPEKPPSEAGEFDDEDQFFESLDVAY